MISLFSIECMAGETVLCRQDLPSKEGLACGYFPTIKDGYVDYEDSEQKTQTVVEVEKEEYQKRSSLARRRYLPFKMVQPLRCKAGMHVLCCDIGEKPSCFCAGTGEFRPRL
jgi:hypothetical protein